MPYATKGTVLLQFGAEWCRPCQTMKPIAEEYARLHGASFAYLDIEKHMNIANAHHVRGLPTFILLKDGEEIGRQQGGATATALRQFLRATHQ